VTLIELMVTISVLALVLLAVAPSVGAWLGSTQIRNVASSIQTGLQRARSEAVRRNEPVRFSLVSLADSAVMDDSCTLSQAGVSWVVSLDDPEGECAAAPSDTESPRIVDKRAGGIGGKNVTVVARTTGGVAASAVVFNGFGRVIGTDAIGVIDVDHVTPGEDYRALRLVLGAGGTVRMCDPKVADADDPRRC
jgi:type IV fimbrial biogenesis protein FimT